MSEFKEEVESVTVVATEPNVVAPEPASVEDNNNIEVSIAASPVEPVAVEDNINIEVSIAAEATVEPVAVDDNNIEVTVAEAVEPVASEAVAEPDIFEPAPVPLPINDVQEVSKVSKEPMAYELLLKIIRSRFPNKVTASTVIGKLVQIISDCIKFLSTVNTMSGLEKKQLVIHAVKAVVMEKVSVDDQPRVLDMVDSVADPIVDELVSLGYNTYVFFKSKLSLLWSKISSCCVSKSRNLLVEIPKEIIMELSKYVDANLQRPFTRAKVINLISEAVKFIQLNVKDNYYGATKKNVVIHVVRVVIEQSDKLKNADRNDLMNILDEIGADFVDAAVEFGKLKL